MNYDKLKKTVNSMMQKGKGILAADESTPTCTKRFESLGIESTPLSRNAYRDMLFTTDGVEEFISGVILYDETIKQSTIEHKIPFPEYLMQKNIIPGIKVDAGTKSLALHNGEKITEGLDGLRDRLIDYYKLGARFAKWRAVITIDKKNPSDACIHANAHALSRYAALCQEQNIVPIVEPEVLMDGDHSIDTCYEVSKKTFSHLFNELDKQNIWLEGIVLKPNMIISGLNCSSQSSVDEVAQQTVECLKLTVPESVPGCAFLSGGQSSEAATLHLNKMNRDNIETLPWKLTFSYGRALQVSALEIWAGKKENVQRAQESFYQRAKFNGMATVGTYLKELEEVKA